MCAVSSALRNVRGLRHVPSGVALPRGGRAASARNGFAVDLIVSHENADFDAFAGSVAASRLHPGATVGLGRRLARPVREFLSLHKDRFPFVRVDHLDLRQVERLVVVDVREKKRLVHVRALLDRVARGEAVEVHVYDHHPATDDDLAGAVEVVEPVGAVTTLLVERIQARELAVDPVEATLFALGIYSDTAALTLGSTTSRDARAVAWLLDRGASLPVLNRYLETPFSDAQRELLAAVLANAHVERIGGLPVGIARLDTSAHVEGLAEVTTEACRLLQYAALFTVCLVKGRKIQVVGRSRSASIDVGEALRAIGGGGHAGAGSAALKDGDADALAETLIETLRAAPRCARTVRDVMSSPVRTVAPELTLESLDARLRAWGHSGVPVVRDGTLLGVVSRRDVERAAEKGRLDLPVASHMSHGVKTTTADVTLEDALAQMVAADVGRLPVVRDGTLIGIVSRSDVLRALYGDANA